MTKKRTRIKGAPTISLCIIARDEERFISDCIDSVRSFVQEVVVLDTGSTDRTPEIAREHGARVEKFTWCDDFAAARNAAIDVATTDWIFMLDADERLLPGGGELLGQYASMAPVIPNGIQGFCPTIINQRLDEGGSKTLANRVMRFFPRLPGLRWVGAIHEDLRYLPEPARLRAIPLDRVRVAHYGYDPTIYAERNKDVRNTVLLEQDFQRNPEDARTLYFLGQQHTAMRRNAEAIPYLRAFLERADQTTREFEVQVVAMLLKALTAIGDLTAAAKLARHAEDQQLLSADAREAVATIEEQRGRFDAAEQHLLRALEPGQPVGVEAPEGVGSWETRLRLARVHEKLGQPQRALEDLDLAFVDLRQHHRGHVALEAAALALRCGAFEPARTWLRLAAEHIQPTAAAHQRLMELRIDLFKRDSMAAAHPERGLALEVAVAAEDWQTAYDAAQLLDVHSPGSLGRLVHVASGLQQAGAPDAALDILDRVLDAPDVPQSAYWLLVSTLTEVGRYDDADTTLELMRMRGIVPATAIAA